MSKAAFTVRYDGPIFDGGHKMPVEDFAPSILALSELVKRTNRILNGDRASVRVLIDADVEQHCLQVGLEIIQPLIEQAKALLADNDIKTAKDIGEILGIGLGAGIGLFGVLKKLRGKKPDKMKITMRDGNKVTQINASGDVFYVAPEMSSLLGDAAVVKYAKAVVEPVGRPGYDRIEFHGPRRRVEKIDSEEARLIQDTPTPKAPPAAVIPQSKIRAVVGIRHAGYMGNAKWTIQYDKARDMTIADEKWLRAFQANKAIAPPGYQLDVEITVSEISVDANGEPIEEPDYAITKVYGVLPSPNQAELDI